jgi:hypothetical protein
MHIVQKRKRKRNKISLAANLFAVLPNEERSSDDLQEADFQ